MPDVMVSHYRLLRKLGAGGMGEVFLAEDTRLGRRVALKMLAPAAASDATLGRRLLKEARAACAVTHPAVAHIYDVGETAAGPWIAMEYVDGEPLNAATARQPLGPQRAAEIALEVADALAAAHAHGVVHRDIKPANIMVTACGVKVLDFGIAQLRPAVDTDAIRDAPTATVTEAGTVVGTVPYMSPEQARGLAVDARTDVWSLGVVLYELLAGRRPFAGVTLTDTIARIVTLEPQPLSAAVPAALERVVRRCLAKDPAARFASASELGEALRAVIAAAKAGTAGPGVVPPESLPTAFLAPQARRAWRRRALLGALVGLAAAALVIAGMRVATREKVPAPIRSLAVLPFESGGADPDIDYLGDGLTEGLINRLSQLPELTVISRSSVFPYKGKPLDPRRIARDLDVAGIVTGSVHQRGDDVAIQVEFTDPRSGRQLWGESYRERTADLTTLEERLVTTIAQHLSLKLGTDLQARFGRRETTDPEAYELYLRGLYQWNRASADGTRQAIDFFGRAIARDPAFARAHAGLAAAYGLQLGEVSLAPRESYPAAIAAARRALEIDPALADPHVVLGASQFYYEWDPRRAEESFRRALRLNPGHSVGHHQLAWLLGLTGRLEESSAEFASARKLDPLSLILLVDENLPYALGGRTEEAIAVCKRVIATDPNFFLAHFVLGWNHAQRGEYEPALAALERAHALEESTLVVAWLGYCEARLGRTAEASRRLAALRQLAETRYVQPSLVALVHVGLGDRDRAFEWLQRGVEARDNWLVWIEAEVAFRELWPDPRWAALKKRIVPGPVGDAR